MPKSHCRQIYFNAILHPGIAMLFEKTNGSRRMGGTSSMGGSVMIPVPEKS